MAQEGSSMEMGTSDQVLVAAKKSKKVIYIVGFVAMVAAIAVVVTLVVVLSGNEGDAGVVTTTTAGPTTVTTTTTTTTTTVTPDPAPTTVTEPTTIPPITEPPPPEITLDDILNGEFSAASFTGSWTSGNEILFRNENGHLVVYNVDEDSTTILVANSSVFLQNSSILNEVSPDGRYVALSFNEVPIYRHSFLAQYVIVDTLMNNITYIVPPGVDVNEASLQNFRWGPSGSIAFVYENDVYYQASLTSEPVRITTSGQDYIYNGVPDWVYEEEVFSSNNALWFSSDGNRLAFATFDDTNVKIMKIPTFGVPGRVEYQYTYHREIRYPKSGTTNPTVTVSVRDLNSAAQTVYNAPTDLNQAILKDVTFINANTIAVMWTDRVQTQMVVELCTQGTLACQRIFSYTQANGWIDNIPMIFNQQGNAFITILPFAVNNVLYKQVVQITQGTTTTAMWTMSSRSNTAHTVLEIMTWTANNVIWYKATSVNDSSEQHIYTVSSTGVVTCFTCDVTRTSGGECLYNDAVINEEATRVTVTCAGPDVPQIFIYDVNGTRIRTWEDNDKVSQLANTIEMPVTLSMSLSLGAGLPDAQVLLQAPPDYRARSNVPLLVYVYAGPDTAQVTKRWNVDWGTSLVSRYNIAVARIDGRGSGLSSVDNMFAVNRKLGTVEVDDQVTVTRLLHEQLPWLDSNRTCVWGWSYGGYAASLALARGTFRCAVAVAPVVDWRFYDTIYTERYMDTPQNNPEGYANSSLLTPSVVEAYRNKRYFLVHGTEDDNVHYQHAMLFSRVLQKNDVYFTQMSYTDEDHGLGGVRHHLYHGLEKFLRENML
ncbi:unnamed protein product [Colias eurytheme]|nr:unnamed protein product [Colias eurytheme]